MKAPRDNRQTLYREPFQPASADPRDSRPTPRQPPTPPMMPPHQIAEGLRVLALILSNLAPTVSLPQQQIANSIPTTPTYRHLAHFLQFLRAAQPMDSQQNSTALSITTSLPTSTAEGQP